MAEMEFIKMHGLGNDFLIYDERYAPFTLSKKQIQLICSRQFGIGCDQMIAIDKSDTCDVFMRIFNSDGEEVSACGNASRCIAWLIGMGSNKNTVTIQTRNRVLECFLRDNQYVTVNMKAPSFSLLEISNEPQVDELTKNIKDALLSVYTDLLDDEKTKVQAPKNSMLLDDAYNLTVGIVKNEIGFTDMGNPHCTFFFRKDEILPAPELYSPSADFSNDEEYRKYKNYYDEYSFILDNSTNTVGEIGSFIENLTMYFPNKINVGFCHVIDRSNVELRVWERGAGETLACGTGACAAVASGIQYGYLGTSVNVILPGSLDFFLETKRPLRIEWSGELNDPMYMTGEVKLVGRVEIETDYLD